MQQIDFPAWVHEGVTDEADIARNRLRFLIARAALQTVQSGNITDFAARVYVDRSQMHQCIRNGRFPRLTAKRIEAEVGRGVLCHEWLTDPMKIRAGA